MSMEFSVSDIVTVWKASLIESGALLRSAECADSASSTLTCYRTGGCVWEVSAAGHYLSELFLDNLKISFALFFENCTWTFEHLVICC